MDGDAIQSTARVISGRAKNYSKLVWRWAPEKFGADGSVLSGPAADPLPSSTLRIDGNDVVVDLGDLADGIGGRCKETR
jgi:hypothetical protein